MATRTAQGRPTYRALRLEVGPKPLFELVPRIFGKLLGHLAPDQRLKLVGRESTEFAQAAFGRYDCKTLEFSLLIGGVERRNDQMDEIVFFLFVLVVLRFIGVPRAGK